MRKTYLEPVIKQEKVLMDDVCATSLYSDNAFDFNKEVTGAFEGIFDK